MKRVRLHPLADDELLSATSWYLTRSETAAAGFVREVEHAMRRIGESPERFPLTRFGRRRFVLLTYPFDVVYRVLETEVEVIAVAHHARRSGYWRNR